MSKSTKTNHYTYIIRHVNGKYYVGRRSTKKDPLLDSYMGSGKWVKSIKDQSTLTKDIIEICSSFEKLVIAEQALIDKYREDEYCMNMSDGLKTIDITVSFNTTQSTICNIKSGRNWGWVEI